MNSYLKLDQLSSDVNFLSVGSQMANEKGDRFALSSTRSGSISGVKWNDLDGDRQKDLEEPGVSGWTIYLEANDNHRLDPGEISTVTDTNGNYTFSNLASGIYTVTELLQPNWQQTYPLSFPHQVTQLTDNDFDDVQPKLSGDRVAWLGNEYNTSNPEVYFYNGIQTSELTDNQLYESDIEISGENVVWLVFKKFEQFREYDVYFYDGGQILRIAENQLDSLNPQISGDRVVWQGYDGNDFEIYLYNGSQVLQLTDNENNDFDPQISGNNVVWSSLHGNSPGTYRYDGSQTERLTSFLWNSDSLKISGNNIVGLSDYGNSAEIYLYNGSNILRLTNNDDRESNPQISGNLVVWSSGNGNSAEIYLYNGSQVLQLTNNDVEDSQPQISGNNVVWLADDGNDTEIYFYNGSQVLQLTDNEVDDSEPQISGNNIVWSASDGNDLEIYTFGQGNTHTINLEPGASINQINFGNWQPATISGTKWHDEDGDGTRDAAETGLKGWTIYLDANNNGEFDKGETAALTDVEGNYSFTVPSGTYTVAEVLQPGWEQITPESGSYSVSLDPGEVAQSLDFGSKALPGEISGTKWNDLDGDRVQDDGEPGLAGWTIYLDANQNGKLDAGETSTLTDEEGDYTLRNLAVGTYRVTEALSDTWEQTYPGLGNLFDESNDTIPNAAISGLRGSGTLKTSGFVGDNPTIYPDSDVDLISIELEAGQRVTIDVDARSFGSRLESILRVFDSQGTEVAVDDDENEDELDAFIDFTASYSDRYYIGISSFDNFRYNPFIEGSGYGGTPGAYDMTISIEDGEMLEIPGFHTVQIDPGETVRYIDFGNHSEIQQGTPGDDVLVGTSNPNDIEGKGGNDRISGLGEEDTLRGGSGNDTVYGGDGNDYVVGQQDNDVLYGGNGNDGIHANTGDDLAIGGLGNDRVHGGKGMDTLIGVDPDNSQPGVNEIDQLYGVEGADRFVLGDASKVYYNDGQDLTSGWNDYASIEDFVVGENVIQLSGKKSDYVLAASPTGLPTGTAIFLETGTTDELIGVVRNVPVEQLDLRGSSFSFV